MMMSLPSQNGTYTPSPSVVGVADAIELSLRMACMGTTPGMLLVHTSLPLVASRQISERDLPSRLAVCRKTRSPQITGLPLPSPGMGAFHRTPLVLLNLTG